MKSAKLITTNSYFNLFSLLLGELEGSVNGIENKNLIFCEEKISLMTERMICERFNGSFNTDVFSFGNYMRNRSQPKSVLSKEGSTMVIKKLLSSLELRAMPNKKANLSASFYDLIIQLKSAGVKPEDIEKASEGVEGLLKDKLIDMAKVYSSYENFIKENNFDDQSSVQDYIPSIIEEDDGMADTNVFLIGYVGWTRQTRDIITSLLRKAKSVTAILTEGENEQVFVNETANSFEGICTKLGVRVDRVKKPSDYTEQGKRIVEYLYQPSALTLDSEESDRIRFFTELSAMQEIERVAQTIKGIVMGEEDGQGMAKGERYKSITVAIPNENYKHAIQKIFAVYDIPYFFDEKKKPTNSAVVSLIISYLDAYRKNKERSAVLAFIKNPLVCEDKTFLDRFENYLLKYNVNFSVFEREFSFTFDGTDGKRAKEELARFNEFRKYICSLLDEFNVNKLLEKLDVEKKILNLAERLGQLGDMEEASVNSQIYEAVVRILGEIHSILGDKISCADYRSLFLSGINALELSIIPQFNDAVFVGGYRECALAKADYLFMVGLTSGVPSYKEDVAMLTDDDISRLEGLKILVEPKIRVVNKRARENFVLSMGAFNKRLFISYPSTALDGTKNEPSESLYYLKNVYKLLPLPYEKKYYTKKQAYRQFGYDVGRYSEGKQIDFDDATSFHFLDSDDVIMQSILKENNKRIGKINTEKGLQVGGMSASAFENFYTCPYKCFATKYLKLNEREIGGAKATGLGTFMHEILECFVLRLKEVTPSNIDEIFDQEKNKLIEKKEYAGFFAQADSRFSANYAIEEMREYCRKLYEDDSLSYFKPIVNLEQQTTEISFPSKEYPAVELLDGKAYIKGRIDRVDKWGDYVRVIDYKTGELDASPKGLFCGKKMQLHLYPLALLKKHKLAGSYYLPIKGSYKSLSDDEKDGGEARLKDLKAKGVTLGKDEVVSAQDLRYKDTGESKFLTAKRTKTNSVQYALTEEELQCFSDYALDMAERATRLMSEGFITPSPIKDGCKYCPFGAMCGDQRKERKINSVDNNTIVVAMGGEPRSSKTKKKEN